MVNIEYNRRNSPLMLKSQKFAKRISNMVKFLIANRDKIFISNYNQVLRSGTSIMANISESQFAQSPGDFTSKLQIALKEANETFNWLDYLKNANCLTETEAQSMKEDCNELIAMLVSSINTSKKNQQIIIK